MTSAEPPVPDDGEDTATAENAGDDSVVTPPAYPAYSTPPPEGLHTGEDG